jgi:hypothetical protein
MTTWIEAIMNIAEHDVVVLTRDVPEHGLRGGDVGAVVHVYGTGAAYEVEFVSGGGQTLAVETLQPTDIRPLSGNEILHARKVTAADRSLVSSWVPHDS